MKSLENKILEIKLDGDLCLIAGDIGQDEYREIYVSLARKNNKGEYVFLQDIAVIGQDYDYKNGKINFLPRFSVKVYDDPETDDWMTEHTVDFVDDTD